MGTGSRRVTLDAVFRIARESAINALFAVMLARQTPSSTRPIADVRKRAQSLVLGMQESIAVDIDLPGFIEELDDVGCGVTDGSDAALVAVVACLQDMLTGSIPPILAG